MQRNLQKQRFLRIVRLSAEGYSQVARILGVSQGCVSKILRRNRDTGRPPRRRRGGRRSLTTAQDRRLIRMARDNRFISAHRLRVDMIRRFGRRLSVRSIVNRLLVTGYVRVRELEALCLQL